MFIGKGIIKLETIIVPKEGAFIYLSNGKDKVRFKVGQADLQVFEQSLQREIGGQFFKMLIQEFTKLEQPEKAFQIIKEIRDKFLQEKEKNV